MVTLNEFALMAEGFESLTFTKTMFVPGPSASPGVQLMVPLLETVNPPGPETKAKVRAFAGKSGSVAVAFVLREVNSLIV